MGSGFRYWRQSRFNFIGRDGDNAVKPARQGDADQQGIGATRRHRRLHRRADDLVHRLDQFTDADEDRDCNRGAP